MREAIENHTFPEFVKSFMAVQFPGDEEVPIWIRDALISVNITL